MKKLIVIMALLFLMGMATAVYADGEIIYDMAIDGVDSPRMTDELIYYSWNESGETGANVWGHEVAVDQNDVVVESAANVDIPEGGYVLSAHGTKKIALKNVKEGDIVDVDLEAMHVTITRDPIKSSYFGSLSNLERAQRAYQEALSRGNVFDETRVFDLLEGIRSDFEQIETLYEQNSVSPEEETQMVRLAYDIDNDAESIIYMTSNTSDLEIRALWHRPHATSIREDTLEGIKDFLDRIDELGFNTLYVETYWNGYVSYRSETFTTHPQVASYTYGEYGDDYIAALIAEADKRGIDVHAWLHTFNAGNISHLSDQINPSWLVENYGGNTLHPNPYGGSYYLDPSNPEVLSFIGSMIDEIAEDYDFAGIQLDYIRYYDNNYTTAPIRESGFSDYANEAFKDAYDLTGDVRTLILDPLVREQWFEWRQNVITHAVKTFSGSIRSIDSSLVVSADVIGDINAAKNTYMQDWLTWVRLGYIDLLAPMIYTSSVDRVDNLSETIFEQMGNLAFLSSGIAPIYQGDDVMTQHKQMLISQNTGGNAIFASHNVIGNTSVERQLKNGIYRNETVSPFSDMDQILTQVITSLQAVLVHTTMTDSVNQMFAQKINELENLPADNPGDYQILLEKTRFLSDLSVYIEDRIIQEVFKEKCDLLAHVIDVRISRELIALGYYDPAEEDRPDPTSFTYEDEGPGDDDDDPGTTETTTTDPANTDDDGGPGEGETPASLIYVPLGVIFTGLVYLFIHAILKRRPS